MNKKERYKKITKKKEKKKRKEIEEWLKKFHAMRQNTNTIKKFGTRSSNTTTNKV